MTRASHAHTYAGPNPSGRPLWKQDRGGYALTRKGVRQRVAQKTRSASSAVQIGTRGHPRLEEHAGPDLLEEAGAEERGDVGRQRARHADFSGSGRSSTVTSAKTRCLIHCRSTSVMRRAEPSLQIPYSSIRLDRSAVTSRELRPPVRVVTRNASN